MEFLTLLARLADLSSETAPGPSGAPRREALARLGQAGAALLPAVLTALPSATTAAPQDNSTPLDVLRLALTLEYLESDFYARALALPNATAFFGSADNLVAIQTISAHEAQHVALLQRLLTDAGATVPAKPNFDFTGSKNGTQAALYPDVFTNLDTFLKVAQLLEDAGVRAYKGQAEFVLADNNLLEALLRTHSTEARHASHIRTMRRQRGAVVKSWVSPADAPITTAGTVPNQAYAGESVVAQYVPGPRLVPFETTLPINVGTPQLSREAILAKVMEAFDEPIDAPTATQLAQLFIH
ncbi:ferritin-like domain-containing protein [Hymenobacter sp. HSC-4F20]|uniref:ferritin-like domain-containing protein n=1 Tax=Hymenobacter sp. HSC-4F20 TaxID=2864135 RepID=UPI001C734054|nr:ferritin-like domain-containing protein [Hymenobacter sp. HSC-4F20]MBX0291085.1 ferritin-like domain-containing protein [Hymenobacter sp. HSC-4F20]